MICIRKFEYSKKRVKKEVFFITFTVFIIVINCGNKFRRANNEKNNSETDDMKAMNNEKDQSLVAGLTLLNK